MIALRRAFALLTCGAIGCHDGCHRGVTVHDADAAVDAMSWGDRCRTEIAHATVASPPGAGAIDAVEPTCGADGTLAVWITRGHTLSRWTRSLSPGRPFAPPEWIATGVDALGPVDPHGALGPVAYRSPTAALEGMSTDVWWAAWVSADPDGGYAVHRGSVVMPSTAVGLGIMVPRGRERDTVDLLTTLAVPGSHPALVHHAVSTSREEPEVLASPLATLTDGELKAWEPAHQVALTFSMTDDDHPQLEAFDLADANAPPRALGRLALTHEHVLVSPHGLATSRGTLFAMTEFDVAHRTGASCLFLDETLCVVPGPVTLLLVTAAGITPTVVAPSGLIDTFAIDRLERVLVFSLAAAHGERAQQVTRYDPRTRAVESLRVPPASAIPPLDHLALVTCDGEPWLAAEIMVSGSAPLDAAPVARESAVMALPAECLFRAP